MTTDTVQASEPDPAVVNAPRLMTAVRIAGYAFACVFFALALAGTVRQYAPVPHYDWWAAIDFYARQAGDWHAWWGQHNEHPIILARPFYWLDCSAFRCNQVSLLALAYALYLAMAALLLVTGRRLLRDSPVTLARESEIFLVAALVFSWLQWENLTQGFQIVFIAAYLLPLAAFVALARAASAPGQCAAFVTALALGIASAFTMGNGIVALPILAIMAWLTRQSIARVVTIVFCAIAVYYVYFANYGAPAPRDVASLAKVSDPVAFVQFLLGLIGAPAGGITRSTQLAIIAGIVVICATIVGLLRWHRRRSPDELALLAIVLYVLASSLGAAAARSYLGVRYALSGRYQTPALVAWAALFVLAVAQFRSRPAASRALATIGFVIAIALVPAQLQALSSSVRYTRFERMFAALALELGIRDKPLVRTLYPDDYFYPIVEIARERGFEIFGQPALSGLRATIGRPIGDFATRRCQSTIQGVNAVEGLPGMSRVVGEVDVSALPGTPARFYFTNDEGRIVGAAVLFGPRVDWRAWIGKRASPIRFGGYLVSGDPRTVSAWCPLS